jgi:hypothetical protein
LSCFINYTTASGSTSILSTCSTATANDEDRLDFELHTIHDNPPTTDVTGDGVINIQDLVFVAAHYGEEFAAADVTGDGKVDIFDLVTVASNFSQ